MMGEVLWQGQPSQAKHIVVYTSCLAFFFLLIPLFYAWRVYRKTRYTRYQVTPQYVNALYRYHPSRNRLLELSRIQKIEIVTPKHYSLSKTHDLVFHSVNPGIPPLIFEAVTNAERINEIVESAIAEAKKARKVQEIRLPILQGSQV